MEVYVPFSHSSFYSTPQDPAHSPDRDRAVTPSPSPEGEYIENKFTNPNSSPHQT